MNPQVLVPYDKPEGVMLRAAAGLAGKTGAMVRTWCQQHDIGRHVAGRPRCVSQAAPERIEAVSRDDDDNPGRFWPGGGMRQAA